MTIRFRLSETDCITIAGVDHHLQNQDENGVVLRRLDDSSVNLSFTYKELIDLLAMPDTRLKRGYFSSAQAVLRMRCDIQYLNTLSPERRAHLLWKATYCRVFQEMEAKGKVCRTDSSVAAAMPEITKHVDARETEWQIAKRQNLAGARVIRRLPPSPSTLRVWIRMFERCGQSPLAFLRKNRGDQTYSRKFAGEVEALLAECVAQYLSRDKPSRHHIVEGMATRFKQANASRQALGKPPLPIPSGRTVRRRIARLDPFQVVAQRDGIDAAKRKFAIYENGISAEHPLQRVEMDEWLVDVETLFGNSGALDPLQPQDRARFKVGRRWVYVAIDCATRCVVSFRIAASQSAKDAVQALELITRDKTPLAQAAGCESAWDFWGGVGSLVTDQGTAFTSLEYRTAVTDIGATYEAPPAGVPKLRGHIERFFGTVGSQLAPMLIGRTFSNPQQRGDYPSEEWASLTDDELAEIFTNFIVDIYHQSPHSGLNGETPANAWKRLAAEQHVTAPPDANSRRVAFGVPLTRKLGRHGVVSFGIPYNCSELQQALLHGHKREIQIRVDLHDLSLISICLDGKWYSAEATPASVRSLSFDQWRAIVRDLRTRFRNEAVLTEETVRRARSRITAIDQRARELMRILPTSLTADELERCEHDVFLGLRIKPNGDDAPLSPSEDEGSNLLGDVIEAPKKPNPRKAPPRKSGRGKKWRFLDD